MGLRESLLRRSVAWPPDHGSWVFLLSPLIIGLAVGGHWNVKVAYLIVASVCGFLVRQPVTIAIRCLSGRRDRKDLPAAVFWSIVYGLIGSIHVLGLVAGGMGYLLYLAVPGALVFAWYLYLVWRKDERRRLLLEIVGAGVFALTAPAGLWAAIGEPISLGWLLWLLAWTQSAASIVYVYLRLEQRPLKSSPTARRKLSMGLPALTWTSLNLLAVEALGSDGYVAPWLWLAYLPQWLEAIQGTWRPAIGYRPNSIGLRQLTVSIVFTLLFITTW